ncbi:vacuolar protein-sorting-associated protein 25 [Apiospora kogelbergensis]|uniref:Vacuolar protein-sorting-associated protein 25 n=1 Tax=Apiospora kogelbergensis TaxID=1337665 RepID=A0AAW0QC14_9PEZI
MTTSNSFDFPREYHFPPFFTRQTNVNTHRAQLEKWSSLILGYCAHHKLYKLSLSATAAGNNDNSSSNAGASADDLFHNRNLNRRLSTADAREVLDFMRKEGRAEFVAGGDNGAAKEGGGDVAWIYWKTPEEWAKELEGWVDDTAQKGTVLTLYELTQGEDTRGSAFHGLDPDLLQKALQVLVKRGKAQIFGQDDSQGVKFF